jgi:AcrR family transcriptional regulator
MASSTRAASPYARRAGEPSPSASVRGGSLGVSEVQRSRMLNSAVQVVSERGYGQMSVARVTRRAGVSRRTFYDLFENREGCFLAAFDEAVSEMSTLAQQAWEGEQTWHARVRASLGALLDFLDERPGVGALVVVEALGAGPRVLEHRARMLAQLTEAIDKGCTTAATRRQPAPLTAEGIVGAVLSVIHARLLETRPQRLGELLNPLMALIVTPYLGHTAAQWELERSVPHRAARPINAEDPLKGLNMRITYRTLRVLTVIAEQPGASNRQIALQAGVSDQGQISKLLTRLERLELVHNTAPPQPAGEPNVWLLTQRGRAVQNVLQIQHQHRLRGGHSSPPSQPGSPEGESTR